MEEKIVILGAGPAGLLLARLLSEQPDEQREIHIYERASALQDRSNEKSFSFAIFKRGFDALGQIDGLEQAARDRCVRIETRVQNWLPEDDRRGPVNNPFMLCERNELVQCLLESLESVSDSRIHIHFDHECVDVDLESQTVTLNANGELLTEKYDLLFGADGAGSALRRKLVADKGYACEDQPYSRVYRNFYLSARGREQLDIRHNELHAWLLPGGLMVGAVPQQDNTVTCNLVFPMGSEEATSAEKQWATLQEHCPEVVAAISKEEQQAFLERPILQCRTINMDCYHYENHACLLGDAAHAVPPSVGQGCNSSLEDAVILSRLLQEHNGDAGQAFATYSRDRVPDMHALLKLSVYAMPLEPELRKEYETKNRRNEKLRKIIPWLKPSNLLDYLAQSTEPFSKTLQERKSWIDQVETSNKAFMAKQKG